MKIYKNPNYKRVRKAHLLDIRCAYCNTFIATYQKIGESNLVKMYHERIIDSSINLAIFQGAIFCPSCNNRIATRYITKMDKKEAFRLVPSAFKKQKRPSK